MSLAPSPSLPYSFSDILFSSTAVAIIVLLVAFLVAVLLAICREFCVQTFSMNYNVQAPNIIALGLPRNPTLYMDPLAGDIEQGLPRNPTAVQTKEKPKGNMVEIVYKSEESEGDNGVKKECCVCLEEFSDGECCMVLACNHTYHRDCINRWLRTNRHCPLCRELV